MMYKLFSLCLLLSACFCATAQKTDGKKQPAKANASTKSEYQVPGSPLAKLKLVSLDTLSKKYKGRKLKKNDVRREGSEKRKNKRRNEREWSPFLFT